MRDRRRVCFVFLVVVILLIFGGPLIAEATDTDIRDDMMLVTLDLLQQKQSDSQREQLIDEVMQKEASRLPAKEEVTGSKSSLIEQVASHAHPYITETFTTDDNIDTTTHDRKSIYGNSVKVGAKSNIRDRKKALTFDLNTTAYYQNHRKQEYNTHSLSANAQMNYNLGRYLLTLSDSYTDSRYSMDELGWRNYSNTDTPPNWTNVVTVGLARAFNRFGFDSKYVHTDLMYSGDSPLIGSNYENDDYAQDSYTLSPYWRLTKKTRLQGSYTFTRQIFEHVTAPPNTYTHYWDLGLTSALFPKTTVSLTSSYQTEDVKGNPLDDLSERVLSVSGKVGYKMSQRSDIAFNYTHTVNDYSVTKANNYTTDDFLLSGSRRLAFNPKFRFTYSAEADFKNSPKLVAPANDKTYTFGTGLSYAFRQWLDFSLSYTHTMFRSNVNKEYSKNQLTFTTQAKF